MDNKEKLFIDSANAFLEQVIYSSTSFDESQINLEIEQIIDLINCDEKLITIRMSRNISSGENKIINMYVSCVGQFHVNVETLKNFKNIDEMKDYVEDKKGILVDKIHMGNYLSQIIANLTGNFGRIPLVLPPIIGEKSDEQ